MKALNAPAARARHAGTADGASSTTERDRGRYDTPRVSSFVVLLQRTRSSQDQPRTSYGPVQFHGHTYCTSSALLTARRWSESEQRMAGLQIALQLLLAAALLSVAVEAAVEADLVTHLPGYVHPDGTPKSLPTRHCELLIRSQTSAFDFTITCMYVSNVCPA